MKKTILLLVALFIVNHILAQEQIENYGNYAKGNIKETGKLDNNKLPIGEWKYYLESGILDYSINWDTNFFKKYYDTGELKESGTFIPETGTHINEWITYYKNGEIESRKIFDENGIEKTITNEK